MEAGRLDLHATDGSDLTLAVHAGGHAASAAAHKDVLQTIEIHLDSPAIDAATVAALNSGNAEAEARMLQHIIAHSGG